MPQFAAKQIARRLYVNRASSIQQMTELSKQARGRLEENYEVGLHAPLTEARSTDGTVKYLSRESEAETSKASTSPTATAQHFACRHRPDAR